MLFACLSSHALIMLMRALFLFGVSPMCLCFPYVSLRSTWIPKSLIFFDLFLASLLLLAPSLVRLSVFSRWLLPTTSCRYYIALSSFGNVIIFAVSSAYTDVLVYIALFVISLVKMLYNTAYNGTSVVLLRRYSSLLI